MRSSLHPDQSFRTRTPHYQRPAIKHEVRRDQARRRAISRLPIFVYGIAIRRHTNYKPVLLLGLLLFFPCWLWASHQLATCVLAIPLIVLCVWLAPKIGKLKDALAWCARQSARYRRAVDCVPDDEHASACMARARAILDPAAAELYLCPVRKITFDGFVSFEGRRFGVPYWYEGRRCRVSREGRYLHIYSEDLSSELACHEVTWSRRDSWCEGQWSDAPQPEELPSQPVTTSVAMAAPAAPDPAFARFDFERMVV